MKTLAAIAAAAAIVFGFAGESQANYEPQQLLQYSSPAQTQAQIVASVSKSRQVMNVMITDADGQTQILTWKVSTGRRGYDTPTGSWSPTWLSRNHKSKTYDDAPMPFAVFFTGGYAVHATEFESRLGTRASHGCVRLSLQNAATFFNLVKTYGKDNTTIMITD
jgi:lipoprotein-anchoring transpeptidase ErfK/SrfK